MLFLIDLQNDYFDPQGKFYFPQTQALTSNLLERIRQAIDGGEAVFFTLNLYTDQDGRSKGERDWAASLYKPFRILLEGQEALTKYYYGISAEEGRRILDRFGIEPPDAIEVAGVETHLCVMANAVIIQNLFPDSRIQLNRERIGSSDPRLEKHALKIMRGMNMEIHAGEK